jgi:tungstate transport system permease protein
MDFILAGLRDGWLLITSFNPALVFVTRITLYVAGVSTGLGLVIGLPIGLALGLGRGRGSRVGLVIANVGLGLPPVVVGIILSIFMFPAAPLGGLHLLFTLNGVLVAQTVLAVPVVTALTASAVRALPGGLLDQARAFGASPWQVALLALREARIGVLAATIAAAGSALSEVGAVVLVGGNVEGADQTLASAALELVNAGDYAGAFAIGILLLALIGLITAALTAIQYWDGRTIGRVRL